MKLTTFNRSQSRPTKKAKDHDVKRMFMFIRLSQALCAAYIVVASFAREPVGLLREDNTIQIRDTVVATNPLHFVCLGISRVSAYSMYPAMVLVFLSKAKALQTWLEGTVLSMFIPFHELHTVHEAMGHWIAVDVWIHTLFHTIRWAEQGNLHFYWTTDTGRSGFIVVAITPFITFPMMFEYFKKRMSFEMRKTLHYLSVPFGIGIAFHAPAMHIGYVMGAVTAIYIADYAVRWLNMTHKIKSSQFVRLDAGIQLTFENPKPPGKGRPFNGGYILLNVPFVSRSEWHAFSVFSHPTLPNHSSIFVSKAGDWTSALHQAVQRPTVRPTWIQGPFPSPFKTTEDYDNLVLVAVGVGITPAMAAINRFKDDGRKYNLVWACRDASLIEYYAHSIAREASGWVMIYYTGTRPLHIGTDVQRLPPNVRVYRGRPNMQGVIAQLIGGVESGSWMPEEMLVWSDAFFERLAAEAKHVNDELDTECAMNKIRAILQAVTTDYAARDMFDILLHTFCNLDSDRDTLDPPALADFFRAMVSPLQHPRAEERAFTSVFDPAASHAVTAEAFCAAIERIVHGLPLPTVLRGLSAQYSNPSSPTAVVRGEATPVMRTRDCATADPRSPPRSQSGSSSGSAVVADFVHVDPALSRLLPGQGTAPPAPGMSSAELATEEICDCPPAPPLSALPPLRPRPGASAEPKRKFELTRVATQRLRRNSSSLESDKAAPNALHGLPLYQMAEARGAQGKGSLAGSDAHTPMLHPVYLQHLRACRSASSVSSAVLSSSASFLERNRSVQEEAMLCKETRDTWQLLFCGGPSPALQSAMHEVARNLGVSLRTETFDW